MRISNHAYRSVIDVEKADAAATAKKVKAKKEQALRDPLMLDLLPPIEKLAISVPEEDCMPIGKIYSIVDRLGEFKTSRCHAIGVHNKVCRCISKAQLWSFGNTLFSHVC